MSKLSFRARALDAAKPLPVYRTGDLPDLIDCLSINRAVPQMPTGMEKEEELEHHLQRAISAQQVFREKKENMVIPVPVAESNITYYDRLYKGEFGIPKQLIHIHPFNLDIEQPDYDMDSEDETLLNRLNRKMEIRPIQFEIMMDRLEKTSGNQLITLQEAKLLLNEDDYLLKSVYDYWVRKRKNWRGPSLIPRVKQEKRDGSTNNDAYVAFRRRTEKMQTRKNRKNDEASYEKMLKLKRHFSRAVTILELIKRREKAKRELLHLTLEVVEKRYQMGDFDGELLNEVTGPLTEKSIYHTPISLLNGNHHNIENKIKHQHHTSEKDNSHLELPRPKRRYLKKAKPEPFRQQVRSGHWPAISKCDIKQYDFHSSGDEDDPQSSLSEPEEENDPDGMFAFRRKAGCQYHAPQVDQSNAVLWDHPELAGVQTLSRTHCLTVLSVPRRCVGLVRRRVGRGGRVIMDRVSSELDLVLRPLDPDLLTASPNTEESNLTDNSVWSSACQRTPNKANSLMEALANIRACRWRCYRPRPRQDGDRELHCPLGNGRKIPQWTVKSRASGVTLWFQSHRQQLAQMQKQQLAQLQQVPRHSNAITVFMALLATQTPGLLDAVSQTLDSVSAQFAASAVVSALRPGGCDSTKDNKYNNSNINGILQSSGTSRALQGANTALSVSSPAATPVHLLRTVPSAGGGTNHLLPVLGSSTHQSLPGAVAACLSSVTMVSPVSLHLSTRTSAPLPSALKLARVAARVTPTSTMSSIARESHEPERLALNGISENTVAMEVT
uniref:Enhancer of polycomb homolog n=1 Tax=Scleropages formosus TaxID=113540 RepID=A0A8C9TS58_SCLFO